MGQRFVACDREQSFLMPPDVREWLPERHLAWFVIDAVAEMDLAAFYAAYRVDGRSRPAYDPAMMALAVAGEEPRAARSDATASRDCSCERPAARAAARLLLRSGWRTRGAWTRLPGAHPARASGACGTSSQSCAVRRRPGICSDTVSVGRSRTVGRSGDGLRRLRGPVRGASGYASSRIQSDACSAIMMQVRLMFARGMVGMTDASSTRRFWMPRSRQCWSITASESSAGPIRAVPQG